jgi:hypothetical protein
MNIMKTIKIIIERSKDTFWAYSENVDGINGVGDTIEEVKKSVLEGIEIQKQLGNFKDGKYQLSYRFDTESFLQYYKGIFTKAALERLTGISQGQLSHYAAGIKKPRPAQIKKIETALHQLGNELSTIEL